MNNQSIIRKSLAFVLLVIFTIGITPKNYWGKCVADHGDYTGAPGGITTVNKTGPDCHCDELVVSAPFAATTATPQLPAHFCFRECAPGSSPFIYATTLSSKDSRGPPAVAQQA